MVHLGGQRGVETTGEGGLAGSGCGKSLNRELPRRRTREFASFYFSDRSVLRPVFAKSYMAFLVKDSRDGKVLTDIIERLSAKVNEILGRLMGSL